MSSSKDAQHRECPAASDLPPGSSEVEPRSIDADWAFQAIHEAGDVSLECDFETTPETNREKQRFHRLVAKYTEEFQSIRNQDIKSSYVVDLFEVFCHPQSNLTHQCQQLGFKAKRFSLEQGDLQSFEGRSHLFRSLVQHSPRNV